VLYPAILLQFSHAGLSIVGAVKQKIQHNNGKIHNFIVSNTYYYSPTAETTLLSLQHWAQVRHLFIKKCIITASLDVGAVRSVTGIKKCLTACQAIEQEQETLHLAISTIQTMKDSRTIYS
jgi:hypothetical protein